MGVDRHFGADVSRETLGVSAERSSGPLPAVGEDAASCLAPSAGESESSLVRIHLDLPMRAGSLPRVESSGEIATEVENRRAGNVFAKASCRMRGLDSFSSRQ